MNWQVSAGDDPDHRICTRVEHSAGIGRVAEMTVFVASASRFRDEQLQPGSKFSLSDGSGRSIDLELQGLVAGQKSTLGLRTTVPDAPEALPDVETWPEPVIVHQRRREDQSITQFIGRVASRPYAEIGTRGREADLNWSLPVGTCLMTRRGERAAVRSARAIAAMARGSRTAFGQARCISDQSWRVLSFNEGVTDANLICGIDDTRWRLVTELTRPTNHDFALEAGAFVDSPWDLFSALHKSTTLTVELGPGLAVPILPMSIRYLDRFYVASEVRIEFFGPPGRQFNVRAEIALVADPEERWAALHRTNFAFGTRLLLGRIAAAEQAPDEAHLLPVQPADPAQFDDLELKVLAAWSSADGQPLRAAQASPGYARKDLAAFYARWTPGDLVLLQLEDASLPLVIGAPRKRIAAYEAADTPELVVQASRILQVAKPADGPASTILLTPDGRVTINAPTELKLTDGISMTPDTLTITRTTNVRGDLDVR